MDLTLRSRHGQGAGRDLDASPDRRGRAVGPALGLAIVTMPLLIPHGPGNTAPADVTITVAVIVTMVWLQREHYRVALPYVIPTGLLMLAGLLASLLAGVESASLAVVQDGFALLWCAALANAIRRRPDLLRLVLRTWVWSGLAWAGLLCFGRIAGINWLAGVSARNGTRASLTFDDPNVAGNYLLCCLAFLLATSVVRRRAARWAGVALILLALLFTGSNGAAVGLIVLVGVGSVLRLRRRFGVAAAVAVVALGGTIGIVAGPHVDLVSVQQKASDSADILRDSLGRSGESTESREVLASQGIRLYLDGNVVGVGPGRTKATLHDDAAPYVKEAHNDYIATLVERGLLGGLGLMLLIWGIGTRLARVSQWPRDPAIVALVPRPEFLVGLGCAFAISAVFYEVLHFRHLWAFLGIVAGIDPAGASPPRRGPWAP